MTAEQIADRLYDEHARNVDHRAISTSCPSAHRDAYELAQTHLLAALREAGLLSDEFEYVEARAVMQVQGLGPTDTLLRYADGEPLYRRVPKAPE